jgi:hypothetical protein
MMGRKISVALAILMVAVFSAQSFAVGPKVGRPPQVTIEDLKGVWDVTVKELLIVGELDLKKEINPATIEFADSNDPMKGEFTLSKTAGILSGFKAACSMAKRGAKILWHIEDEEAIEDSLKEAIRAWVLEDNINLIGDPVLDIRSYAYKPIVVDKKTASPKLGIFQVKGSVTMTIDDGTGGQITEANNFKYQCNFKFGSKDLVGSAAADDEEGLDE